MSVSGAYLMYPHINLADVDRVNVEISGQTGSVGGNWTLRAGSPTGPIVARLENLPDTGTTYWGVGGDAKWVWLTDDIVDPGGVNDLYVVVDYPPGATPGRVSLRNMQFVTAPESVTATVDPATPDGANGWYKTNPVVTVDVGGMPLWTRQTSVDGGATWQNAADGKLTISGDGTHTVLYRAIDNAGVVVPGGSLELKVDGTAPASTLTGVVDGATYGDSFTRQLTFAGTDATSGVGSTAATIDGRPLECRRGIWPLWWWSGPRDGRCTLSLFRLSLGEHTLEVTTTDLAGNTGTTAVTFTVDTSFEDMRGLIEDLAYTNSQRKKLIAELDQARTAARRGQTSKAIRELRDFKSVVRNMRLLDGNLRSVLLRDSDAMLEELGG